MVKITAGGKGCDGYGPFVGGDGLEEGEKKRATSGKKRTRDRERSEEYPEEFGGTGYDREDKKDGAARE